MARVVACPAPNAGSFAGSRPLPDASEVAGRDGTIPAGITPAPRSVSGRTSHSAYAAVPSRAISTTTATISHGEARGITRGLRCLPVSNEYRGERRERATRA